VERVRAEALEYWAQRREAWRRKLSQELLSFKQKSEVYGKLTLKDWKIGELMPELEPVSWERFGEKMVEHGDDTIHAVETRGDELCSVMPRPQTDSVTATIMVVRSRPMVSGPKRVSHH
jgi:hypothetical protein